MWISNNLIAFSIAFCTFSCVSCGAQELPDDFNNQNDELKQGHFNQDIGEPQSVESTDLGERTSIKLMKVDKDFSELPVDWTTFGRSENMYVLTYAMDIKLCSIIGNALNVEYIPNTYFDAQQSVGGELYIKNPLSVKWVNLGNSPSGITQYTSADIDHDGKQELLVRRSYTRNRLVQSINKYDAKHEELFLSAKYQYPKDGFIDQQVLRALDYPESVGMVRDQKIFREDDGVLIQTNYAMGQTMDLVEVNGLAYILTAPNGDRIGKGRWWPVNILQYMGEDRFVNLCSFANRF